MPDGARKQDIADTFGCSSVTIQKTMYANGILKNITHET